MTTVLVLARSAFGGLRVEGILRWAVLVALALGRTTLCVSPAAAQERPVHRPLAGAMPPGAIGSLRLERGGPLSGFFQPVRIRAPQGARIALAGTGGFAEQLPGDVLVGLPIGPVYRLRVSDIPNLEVAEIYPTVEVVDRLYPPPGLALRYPIPIELTQDELEMASRGSFVTRVIYVENPHQAMPLAQLPTGEQPWIEAAPGEDLLAAAERRGRPVAILRVGGRVPVAGASTATVGAVAPPYIMYDANEVDAACPIQSASNQSANP